jgi:quercetin dioxygenase-like cupin family protein
MRSSRAFFAALLAVLALAGLTNVVSATPPSGQTPSALAVGRLSEAQTINTDRIKVQTKGITDVAMFTVTYDPGGYSGWHTHPGVLFVVVRSGAVIRTVSCQSTTYHAGESFVESDEQPSGEVRNASTTEPAVLSVTQIVPKDSPRRSEADQPAC